MFTVLMWFAGARAQRVPAGSVTSGAELYTAYCASCHGGQGAGDGAAASGLKIRPADLTVLARQNGGSYPAHRVNRSIEWGSAISSHQPREMPVWGMALRPHSRDNQREVNARIRAMTNYIGTLQVN